MMEDEREEIVQFGDKLTGQDKRIAEAQAALAGESGEAAPGKKKKKKAKWIDPLALIILMSISRLYTIRLYLKQLILQLPIII